MAEKQETSGEKQPKQEKSTAPAGKDASKRKKALIVIAIVAGILVVVGGAYWFGTRQGKEEVPSEEEIATESAEVEEIEEVAPSPTVEPTEAAETTPIPTPSPSPTPTPTPEPTTETLSSSVSLDGFRASNGGGNAGIEIRVGRNVSLVMRGFVSFGTAHIPSDATIEKAILRLYQTQVKGDPYGSGVRVKVDHLDYGDSLENADYSASSISGSFATLSEDATVGWKEVDVTDAVRNDRENNRERSQFRLHMAVENIGGTATGDFAYFESADNSEGTGNAPQLVVTYY
jgi:type IV secretory pathway VirB10-like protein